MPRVNPIDEITNVSVSSINSTESVDTSSQTQGNNSSIASTEYYYKKSKEYAQNAAQSANEAAQSAQQAQQDVDEIVTSMQGVGTIHLDKAGRAITISTVNYVHEQDVASDEWTINHNLGKRPSVVIVDSSGKEFYPPVTHISDNTCIVEPIGAMTGIAYLN